MKKPVLVGIAIVLVILGVLIYSSMNLAKFRVEVCITYNGKQSCNTASGSTEAFAQRAATTGACSPIASGVTESMQCEATPPTSVTTK